MRASADSVDVSWVAGTESATRRAGACLFRYKYCCVATAVAHVGLSTIRRRRWCRLGSSESTAQRTGVCLLVGEKHVNVRLCGVDCRLVKVFGDESSGGEVSASRT